MSLGVLMGCDSGNNVAPSDSFVNSGQSLTDIRPVTLTIKSQNIWKMILALSFFTNDNKIV